MRKIALVGAGGINSWCVHHLHQIIEVFEKKELMFIKIFDNDIVEEKNILRENQNFKVEELMEQKAKALGDRYGFDYENVFITEDNLDKLQQFDDIIVGVDNNKIRKLLYDYCLKNGKYILDLRAQGTQMAFYLPNMKDINYWNEKLFSNEDVMNRKGSCQLQADVDNDNIQSGNKIIATIGMWGLYLKHIRGEDVSTHEWKWAY